jgi:hypothetical protein
MLNWVGFTFETEINMKTNKQSLGSTVVSFWLLACQQMCKKPYAVNQKLCSNGCATAINIERWYLARFGKFQPFADVHFIFNMTAFRGQ